MWLCSSSTSIIKDRDPSTHLNILTTRQVPKGQIPPLALPSQAMHLLASPMANTATQQPLARAIDANHHALFGHLHPSYAVDFQSQLFSVMSFDEHSTPPLILGGGVLLYIRCAALSKDSPAWRLYLSQPLNSHYTFGIGGIFLDPSGSISAQGNTTSTRKIFLELSGFCAITGPLGGNRKMFLDLNRTGGCGQLKKCS